LKQNKQNKLKQYIEDTLENKKERKIKKRYIIFLSLFIHIAALLIVFFFLEYSKQDYFSDLFKKPAQVKFQQTTKQSQTKSQFTPSQNAQVKQQALQHKLEQKTQIEPEKEKIMPIEPLNLPTFQGLNKPLPPKNVEKPKEEQDSGINKLFDTKKESEKESSKEKHDTIKTQKPEESTPKPEEQKPLFNEEEQEQIEKKKTEKPEPIEKDSLFLRKLKTLEKELEQNKKEREKFTQKIQDPQKPKTKDIEKPEETQKLNKKDPRDFVIKKSNSQEIKKEEKKYNSWNFSTNKKSENKKTHSRVNEKNVTLADISKGFLDYTEQQGANLIQYTNAIEGAPTEEQLKHERYIKKIFDCIETTMKIKSNTLTFHKKVDPNEILTVLVKIILENNGKVSDMKIMQSSGFIEFDRFMLNIVNNSSSGFPPVPSYLSKDKYPLPVKFFIPVQMVASRM
jgi:TonB family protein